MNAPIQTEGFGSQDPRKEADKVVREVAIAKVKIWRGSSERQRFLFSDVQPPHQNLYGVYSIPVIIATSKRILSLLSSVT